MKLSHPLILLSSLSLTLALANPAAENEAHVPIAHDPSVAFHKRAPAAEPNNEAHIPLSNDIASPHTSKRALQKRLNIRKGVGEVVMRPATEEIKDKDHKQWLDIALKKWAWREGREDEGYDEQPQDGDRNGDAQTEEDQRKINQQQQEIEQKIAQQQAEQAQSETEMRKQEEQEQAAQAERERAKKEDEMRRKQQDQAKKEQEQKNQEDFESEG